MNLTTKPLFHRFTALLLAFAMVLSLSAGALATDLPPDAGSDADSSAVSTQLLEDALTTEHDSSVPSADAQEVQDISQDILQDNLQDVSQNTSQDILQDNSQGSTEGDVDSLPPSVDASPADTLTDVTPEVVPESSTPTAELTPQAVTPVENASYTGAYFPTKDKFLAFSKSFTPAFTKELPQNIAFVSTNSSVVSVNEKTGKLTANTTAGRADIQLFALNEEGNADAVPLDTLTVYTYHPTSFTVSKTDKKESPRILHTTNTVNQYASRDYTLYKQQFDSKNYAWLWSHGCAVAAAADIAQGYGATGITPKWLSNTGVAMLARSEGLGESTISNGLKNKTMGFVGIQRILEYAGISSEIVSNWKDTRVAVEDIVTNLSNGRPVIMCIYKNTWQNPRTGKTIQLASSYHYMIMTGIDKDGYILNSCGSSANVQTNNSLNGYEVKITVTELLEHFLNNKTRQNNDDFFYDASSPDRSGTLVYLKVTCDQRKTSVYGKTVTLSKSSYTYNGKACAPTVTVAGLKEGTDYTVSYKNNVNAGTATAIVTAKGKYVGTLKKTFTIKKASINSKPIILSSTSYLYTGKEQTPKATITGFQSGTDFTVSYKNNVEIGTATVTATGKGSCSGTTTTTFSILPAPLEGKTAVILQPEWAFTGQPCTPAVTIEGLTQDIDFTVSYANNVNAGTATAIVTGKGHYTGSLTAEFSITRVELLSLDDAMLIHVQEQCQYTGSPCTPAVTVEGLTQDVDFTVDYSNNLNVGTATVTITGIGAYQGTLTTSFSIVPAPLEGHSITLSQNSYVYSGKACAPTVTIDALTSDTDFTVSYKNNVNAGTATVTVTGKGNFTGSLSKNFKISKANPIISGISSKTLSASSKAQTVKPNASSSPKLSLSYSSNNKKVTVSQKGVVTIPKNFSGVVTISIYTPKHDNYHRVTKTVRIAVKPAPVAFTKLSYTKNTITAQWNKNSSATGYELQYSTSSSFSTSKTKTITLSKTSTLKATLSSLSKNKTYYVRIRTYQISSGQTLYSAWSAKKTVKL